MNMSRHVKLTSSGRGSQLFNFIVPQGLGLVKKNNPILLIAGFRDQSGKIWPWEIRGNTSFIDNSGVFLISRQMFHEIFSHIMRK
jgi:hypothetical protein